MAISSLVPRREAERVLLEELQKEGRPIKTGELVKSAIKRFPALTPSELQRRTPSGTLFWPGFFRYALNELKKKGEAIRVSKGHWQITKQGINTLARLNQSPEQKSRLSKPEKELLDWAEEVIKSIKQGEVKAIITTRKGGFSVELGEHIKETKIVLGGV